MTTINGSLSTAINSAILTGIGAELGKSLGSFGAMQFTLGAIVAGLFQPAPAQQPFTATMPGEGKAEIDIGDGYTLSINEASSEIVVRDADGNATRVWGDPHVSYNGEHIGDFWGTTTFQLENGTKITINTETSSWNNMTYAEQVVVTRGDQAIVIDGVSEQTKGDFSVTLGGNGYALDAAHDDGLVIHEDDASATGWTSSIDGGAVGQADFDLTKPGAEGLRETLQTFHAGLGLLLTGWLLGAGAGLGLSADASVSARAADRFPLLNL
ncbi:hypothetical protein DMC25_12470 [Caulobacter sp. D4A]|uniref:DUF1521 domain-containing protein n=1 Tax=unclassified Caulobacter TaxID=2648921 RepID=UPI000D7352C9|nr:MULTISPECIES: DUF1521 domain-containing protein [unclassified Caulobacter]PXA87527.1 hypothetical protein DMC25_12470 [Caulobacter sp. D4A]PXA89602.1 hypothetical protein DMC18_16570 [Caulobacter sp. D5]